MSDIFINNSLPVIKRTKVEVQEENSRPYQPPSQARPHSLAACSYAHTSPRNPCSPAASLSAPCGPEPARMPAGTSGTEEASVLPPGKWLTTAPVHTRSPGTTVRSRANASRCHRCYPATAERSVGQGFPRHEDQQGLPVHRAAISRDLCSPTTYTPRARLCPRSWGLLGPMGPAT